MAEPGTPERQPGWREVLIVAACVVAVVLVLGPLTSLMPTQVQAIVFHTPLMIFVLIGLTGFWLWRVSRRQSGPREP